MKLTNSQKIFLVIFCFICSVIGFMVRLPAIFSHNDKGMHTLFYFLAAAFINILFGVNNIWKHIMIFVILFVFGICIEYGQEYSNKFLHRRIHGRFDPEDVVANLKGLIAFSILWLIWVAGRLVFKSAGNKTA